MSTLSIVDLLKTSLAMDVLIVMSIVTVTFAIERWWYFARTNVGGGRLLAGLRKHVASGDDAAALESCVRDSSPAARVAESLLRSGTSSREDLDQTAAAAMEKQSVEMERNLIVLGTMSNIAPLMGLFGTVMGIIRSFRDIALTGSGGSSVIAMGVSEALLTTAVGIVIAVIATVFYNAFIRRVRVRAVQMEEVARVIIAAMASRGARTVAARPQAAPAQARAPQGAGELRQAS